MVPDPRTLTTRPAVDGAAEQGASTAGTVIEVDALVSAASHLVTLEPGDVLLTSTPAEIEGLGRRENRIVALAPAGA